MPVTINGASGVTTPGLASTAMPTSGGDPIVESGSNSDGEWTRWADGTQRCGYFESLAPGSSSTSGAVYISSPISRPFPLPFVSLPTGACSIGDSSNLGYWAIGRPFTTSGWRVKVYRGTSFAGTGSDADISFTAIGRWK